MPAKDKFRIEQGMDVIDQNRERVGRLDNIFSEDRTGASRFIHVNGRLLPVETIAGTEERSVKLTVPRARIEEFPKHAGAGMPSEEEQRQAYGVLGLSGPAVDRP